MGVGANAFMDSLRLDKFRSIASERKRIAERIKELQPEVSNRQIARTLGVGHDTVDRDLGRENAGANAPTRLQTPSEAARAAGAHAPSGPTGTQAAKLVERRETGKAERQHLGLRGVPALSVTRREAAGSAPG